MRTFQAEDEIAAIGAALGAAFGGSLAVTTTSGPGVALKSETIGLAVSLELPLLVVAIQRGGPSTGLPTKTEQADLLQAMYGRNGEAPVPVVAARTPADCFDAALDAARIALTYRTPVFLLSRRLPRQRLRALADPRARRAARPAGAVRHRPQPRAGRRHRGVLALQARHRRRWPAPGRCPARPVSSTASAGSRSRTAPATSPTTRPTTTSWSGPGRPRSTASRCPTWSSTTRDGARTLVLGWGSTYGPITAAVRRLRAAGVSIAQAHLRHLNPFPRNLGEILARYDKVVVPEMNLGQLATLIRAKYLVDAHSYNQVNGMPFKAEQLATALKEAIDV